MCGHIVKTYKNLLLYFAYKCTVLIQPLSNAYFEVKTNCTYEYREMKEL